MTHTANISSVNKERCPDCQKFISTHNRIMPCQGCSTVFHAKCSEQTFVYNHVQNNWLCSQCHVSNPAVYNPFNSISNYDKHDPNNLDEIDDLRVICNILDSCEAYNVEKFNCLTKSVMSRYKSPISVIFNNIDGNASNFDSFVADISQYKTQFSVIAIAETNTIESHKDLYQICNYNVEYNSKLPGKRKGSGLGMYIHNNFQFTKIDKFCQCSPNLESMFVELTNTEQAVTVGVIYRPPSGKLSEFFTELDALMKMLPSKNVMITGDYNVDLLQPNSSQLFEQTIYGHNFIPTISIATHERRGHTPTLIDNILINSTDNLIKAGVLESKVSDHSPIFVMLKCPTKECNANDKSSFPRYMTFQKPTPTNLWRSCLLNC